MLLHVTNIRTGHGLQGGVGGEKPRGDQIHPGIGTLGGKPHGNHQLVVLAVVQGTQGIGIALLQNIDNGGYFFVHNQGSLWECGMLERRKSN